MLAKVYLGGGAVVETHNLSKDIDMFALYVSYCLWKNTQGSE